MKNLEKMRELRPDLNGNPFFLALGKALAKKDWEWKAEIGAQIIFAQIPQIFTDKKNAQPKAVHFLFYYEYIFGAKKNP